MNSTRRRVVITGMGALTPLGLTAEDIADLEKERQPSATVVVRAPSDGTVIDRFAYEGQYVAAGDRIVETGDFTKMWFLFDVYEPDMALLQVGQLVDVTTDAIPGETLTEPISLSIRSTASLAPPWSGP